MEERATAGVPTYDFTHGQVRQLVYDHTSLARRRLLHRRVAEALLATARPRCTVRSVAAVVAHHEQLAGREDLAAEHFRQAGDHARAVYANADARTHYDAALALGHPAVAELHEAIGDLQTLDGRFVDAVASFERAAARAEPLEQSLASRASSVASTSGAVSGRPPSSTTPAALAALGDDGPLIERARLTADLAITAHRQGDTDRAAELADRALGLAEQAGDDAALAHAGTVAGLLAAGRGDLRRRAGRAHRSLERAGPSRRSRRPRGRRQRAGADRADGRRPPTSRGPARRGASRCAWPSATAIGRRPFGTSSPRCSTAWGVRRRPWTS